MKDNERLVLLKETYDSYKVELKVAEKELANITKTLKDDYDIESIEDAEQYIQDMQRDIDILFVKQNKKIKQIETRLANYRS
jgi:hypothetical protein